MRYFLFILPLTLIISCSKNAKTPVAPKMVPTPPVELPENDPALTKNQDQTSEEVDNQALAEDNDQQPPSTEEEENDDDTALSVSDIENTPSRESDTQPQPAFQTPQSDSLPKPAEPKPTESKFNSKELLAQGIEDQDIELVQKVVQTGIDLNVTIPVSHFFTTKDVLPLNLAIGYLFDSSLLSDKESAFEIVKLLLENGADPNSYIFTNNGNLLSHINMIQDNYELDVAKIFLKYGANPNQQNNMGSTPLRWVHVTTDEDEIEFTQLLLKSGANPNVQDNQGRTPLHWMRYISNQNKIEFVQLLLAHGANPNIQDSSGETPLHWAIRYISSSNGVSLVKLLLQNQSNPNIQDNDGETPLHWVVKFAHKNNVLPLTQLLLEHKANPNTLNKDKNTPLHMLPFVDNDNEIQVAKLLLDYGADKNLRNKDGKFPRDTAMPLVSHGNISQFIQNYTPQHEQEQQPQQQEAIE